MPNIVNPDEMKVVDGAGWEELLLADSATFGEKSMVAKRWNVEPMLQMPPSDLVEVDTMLYVISGAGKAQVGAETFVLELEDVLWLEPQERVILTAGEAGLSILVGYRERDSE